MQQLAMFPMVARHRNLTKASAELGRSQPALSRDLARLQDEDRVKLFQRVWKWVRITPEGEELLKRARLILDRMSLLGSTFQADVRPIY